MLNSVFGQGASLAQTVFERYQETLRRADIQEVLPAILETLHDPAFQSDPLIVDLGGLDAALDLVLENPDILLTLLPDAIDPYYITLLKTDNSIRGFFRDPDVRALMKDPDAVEELASLLGITLSPDPTSLDVNGDGRVDVLDLLQVALFYGKRGENLPEDINADGVINVPDLVAVAEGIDAADDLSLAVEQGLLLALAEAAALQAIPEAPMAVGKHQHALSLRLTYDNVTDALADVRILAGNDMRLRKGVAVFEELLQLLSEMRAIPETTALLPNYPNPFNPDTWIPYQLSTPSAVRLFIYGIEGRLVRTLDLGHQPVGVYRSRGRAAYWDGRNQLGEKVASGVYFYTLSTESTRDSVTAGDFTATRKMLIKK